MLGQRLKMGQRQDTERPDKTKLGWTPQTSFGELVREMVQADLSAAQRDELIKSHGYKAMDYKE